MKHMPTMLVLFAMYIRKRGDCMYDISASSAFNGISLAITMW